MDDIKRDLGEQPIAQIMRDLELIPHDLVANSTEQLTHKMVKKACSGRRLSSNVKIKIRDAINRKAGREYSTKELFNY